VCQIQFLGVKELTISPIYSLEFSGYKSQNEKSGGVSSEHTDNKELVERLRPASVLYLICKDFPGDLVDPDWLILTSLS
jgi:hypothetical protein